MKFGIHSPQPPKETLEVSLIPNAHEPVVVAKVRDFGRQNYQIVLKERLAKTHPYSNTFQKEKDKLIFRPY